MYQVFYCKDAQRIYKKASSQNYYLHKAVLSNAYTIQYFNVLKMHVFLSLLRKSKQMAEKKTQKRNSLKVPDQITALLYKTSLASARILLLAPTPQLRVTIIQVQTDNSILSVLAKYSKTSLFSCKDVGQQWPRRGFISVREEILGQGFDRLSTGVQDSRFH